MTKLLQLLEIDEAKYLKFLMEGNLYEFEESLYDFVMRQIYDKLASHFINKVLENKTFLGKLSALSSSQGMGKLQIRSTNLQIRTGSYIEISTQYACKVPKQIESSRYLAFQYWGVIKGASPSYYSQVSKFSVLCNSFEIVSSVLDGLQIKCNSERIRSLSLSVSKKCLKRRIPSMLDKGESLAGKRVIISTDGGRIRTRQYKEEKNLKATHHKFNTPWKEPKLLLISVIDEEGKMIQKELPIYDATFGEESLFNLLKQYLKALNISEAAEVQVVADGALWIWNNTKKMLIDLGVSEDKIVETLDYYHAVEHLKKITELLPKKQQSIKGGLFKELKSLLWEGNIKAITTKIRGLLKRSSKKINTEIAYFEKNEQRMNYAFFRQKKWLCGSGIIESGGVISV
jgi:hypothetical protein